ncbi:protein kinase subdomain-containing protein [Ilyonectria robusta]
MYSQLPKKWHREFPAAYASHTTLNDIIASKHPLRRSCAFCLARKIKCSNKTICEACRRQGADCIYDFETTRPKTRNLSQNSTKSSLSVYSNGDVTMGLTRQRSTSIRSPNSTPPSTVMEEVGAPGETVETVAMALEQRFFENFSQEADGPRSSPWQERIAAYHRALQNSLRDRPESAATKFRPKNIRYTGILSLLTHDIVGLVTDQFGSLGCHHVEDGGACFFMSGLASDDTETMFDIPPLGSNPLSEYGQRQQTQLIDVSYSTLLLRELRDGTHDEILLATMLADANFSIGDEVAIARGHVLLRWAIAQLRTRPLRPTQNSPNGGSSGISTRIFGGISTAQALMLLAWNALCSFQLRQAICYIGLAGRMASEIKDQISNTSAPMASSRINGIDVFDVEKEIVAYLH